MLIGLQPDVVPDSRLDLIYPKKTKKHTLGLDPRLERRRVLDANIASLLQTKGLRDASAVVLSGHSAGGLATYHHADYVRASLPADLKFYAAVPDAGFFLDHPTTAGEHRTLDSGLIVRML